MEYLLVDGYNIINAWTDLNKILKEESIENSREKLIEIMSNYQGYKNINIVVVFDAHKVKGSIEKTFKHKNIYIVYTAENKTADNFIEKFVHDYSKGNVIKVATSDGLEQALVLGGGAIRISARELKEHIGRTLKKGYKDHKRKEEEKKLSNRVMDSIPREVYDKLEKMRLDSKNID